MAKIRVQPTDLFHLSLLFIYINKIYWRQFPVAHRWNLLLQLFNLYPNLLILIISPQSIVQIPVLIPLRLKFLHFFQDLHRLDREFLVALGTLAFGA